jgi:hypothetical protein
MISNTPNPFNRTDFIYCITLILAGLILLAGFIKYSTCF